MQWIEPLSEGLPLTRSECLEPHRRGHAPRFEMIEPGLAHQGHGVLHETAEVVVEKEVHTNVRLEFPQAQRCARDDRELAEARPHRGEELRVFFPRLPAKLTRA